MMSMQPTQQQSQRIWGGSTSAPLITVDALVPDERTATDLVNQFVSDQQVQEVAFHRENGTPYIRVSLQPGAVQGFQDRIQQLTEALQRSYQSAGFTGR